MNILLLILLAALGSAMLLGLVRFKVTFAKVSKEEASKTPEFGTRVKWVDGKEHACLGRSVREAVEDYYDNHAFKDSWDDPHIRGWMRDAFVEFATNAMMHIQARNTETK